MMTYTELTTRAASRPNSWHLKHLKLCHTQRTVCLKQLMSKLRIVSITMQVTKSNKKTTKVRHPTDVKHKSYLQNHGKNTSLSNK